MNTNIVIELKKNLDLEIGENQFIKAYVDLTKNFSYNGINYISSEHKDLSHKEITNKTIWNNVKWSDDSDTEMERDILVEEYTKFNKVNNTHIFEEIVAIEDSEKISLVINNDLHLSNKENKLEIGEPFKFKSNEAIEINQFQISERVKIIDISYDSDDSIVILN